MSNLITIGKTAQVKDIIQDRRGDFRWSLDFYDVSATGVETDQDLTGCSFDFIVYAQDGTTELVTLSELGGIVVVGKNVQIDISLSEWSAWISGCKYPYFFRKTDAAGFRMPLFEGNFILT